MDDFGFRGKHIAQFGAVAAFGTSMRFGGKAARGEYELPGGGSVLIGEDTWQTTTRSVVIMPADGVEADMPWARRLAAWLQGGRGELVVDNDPDVIRIAQFDEDGTYGDQGWPMGCLQMSMKLLPLAYDALRTQREMTLSAGETGSLALCPSGPMSVPLRMHIVCTSGTITGVCVQSGGKMLNLPGVNLDAGQTLEYDGGEYLGDPVELKVDGAIDFSPAQGGSWAQLDSDGTPISVTLTGGAGKVTLSVRGRWPA